MGVVNIIIKASGGQAKRTIEANKKALKGLAEAPLGIAKSVGFAVAAMAGLGVAMDGVMGRAKKVQDARDAFQILGFGIGDAQERLKGFAKTQDIIAARNKSVQLGLNLSSAQFASLAESAAKAGRVMGQDVNASLNDVILGIGRQSRLILDNIGVIVKVEKANKDYAVANNIVGRELTDTEKKAAFTTAAIEALDSKTGSMTLEVITAADQWVVFKNKMSTAVDNVVVMIGKNEALGFIIKQLTRVLGDFGDAVDRESRKTAYADTIEKYDKAVLHAHDTLKEFNLGGLTIFDEKARRKIISGSEGIVSYMQKRYGKELPRLMDRLERKYGDTLQAEFEKADALVTKTAVLDKRLREFGKKGASVLKPGVRRDDDEAASRASAAEAEARAKAEKAQQEKIRADKIAVVAARDKARAIGEAAKAIEKAEHATLLSLHTTEEGRIGAKLYNETLQDTALVSSLVKRGLDKAGAAQLRSVLRDQRGVVAKVALGKITSKQIQLVKEAEQAIGAASLKQQAGAAANEQERIVLERRMALKELDARLAGQVAGGLDAETAARLRNIEAMVIEEDAARRIKEVKIASRDEAIAAGFSVAQSIEGVAGTALDASTRVAADELAKRKKRIKETVKDSKKRTKLIEAAEAKSLAIQKRNERIKAIIGIAMQTAQAIAAFATLNITAGIGHTAAAVQYGVAAALAGGGGGGGGAAAGGGGGSGSAPDTGTRSAGRRRDSPRDRGPIIINLAPGAITDPEQTGNTFKQIIEASEDVGRGRSGRPLEVT